MKRLILSIPILAFSFIASAEFVFTSDMYKQPPKSDVNRDISWMLTTENGFDTDLCNGFKQSEFDTRFAYVRANSTKISDFSSGNIGTPEGWRWATAADLDTFSPVPTGSHDFHNYYYNSTKCGNTVANGNVWPSLNGVNQYYFALKAQSSNQIDGSHYVHAGGIQGYYSTANIFFNGANNFGGFILVKE